MKLYFCIIFVSFLFPQFGDWFTKSSETIYKEVSPSIVKIETYDQYDKGLGSGSGVIMSKDGMIITNAHVIKKAHSIRVETSNGKQYFVKYIWTLNWDIDYAIIKIDAQNLPTVSIGESKFSELNIAQKIYTIGNPHGLSNTITDGLISNKVIHTKHKYDMIQLSAAITHGSSGGALIDEYGKVIGITTSGYDTGNIGFAIPMHEIKYNKKYYVYTMKQFATKYGIKYSQRTRTSSSQRTSSSNSDWEDIGLKGWLFIAWIVWGLLPPY